VSQQSRAFAGSYTTAQEPAPVHAGRRPNAIAQAQGGGLVRSFLSESKGECTARALTRDVNSDKARALASQGAEVVAADIDDVQSIKRTFKGAHGAYCVTFYWAKPEKELAEASAIAKSIPLG